MHKVTVRALQANLRDYLKRVRAGEVVLIVEKGKVIAELKDRSDWKQLPPGLEGLQEMVDRGLIRAGGPNDPSAYKPSPVHLPPGTAKRLLDEEREDRF
jgi:prevent-host-death family protein